MNFSPNNFYIGVIDLFAIILPGSIVALALYYYNHDQADVFLRTTGQSDFFSAFVLLFASYLFGHIISQASAYLDKYLYDKVKDKIYKNQSLLNHVKKVRTDVYRNTPEDLNLVSTYEWAQLKLQKELPLVVQEAERYIADSKFFRSLLLILFVFGFILFFNKNYSLSVSCFLIAGFSLIRYFHKRQKAVKTLYKGIVFIEMLNGKLQGIKHPS